MIQNKFCHNCGKQLIAGAKFCSECGTSLSSLTNKPTPTASAAQFTPFAVGRDEDDDDSYLDKMEHANIRQTELHVDIIKDRPLGESVGSLISQAINATTSSSEPARPVLPTAQNREAFLAEFKQEAGTLRK